MQALRNRIIGVFRPPGDGQLGRVIINGILTFMLTPGDAWLAVAGTGQEASRFWHAFFNPTY